MSIIKKVIFPVADMGTRFLPATKAIPKEMLPVVDKPRKGAGGKIQITDAMADLIGTIPMHGYHFDGTRYDCGSKAGYLAANLAYGLKDENLRDNLRNQIEEMIK